MSSYIQASAVMYPQCITHALHDCVLLSGFFNQVVQIKFSLLSLNATCKFLTQRSARATQKVCTIAYGIGDHYSDCTNSSLTVRKESSASLPDVTIKLLEFPKHHSQQNHFCFIITAVDETSTVQVAGTLSFNPGMYIVCCDMHL